MKKILFIVALFAAAFVQGFAQDSTKTQTSQLLHSYYEIKNALVAGNANTASTSAEQFVKTTNGIDYKVISEGNINALLKNATVISESRDLKVQRMHFENLSTNMFAVAKAVKLTTQPVYYAYCPMKKVYWLSSEAAIKNPYFGSAMPTCGKVVETLK
jgi:hypothetical protein